MADPNDDLLEDVDIGDGHFELDLDEDALLADDYDEKPMKSLRTSDIGRNHISMEDEDFIEIGVDEDLALADEAKNEGDIGKTARKAIVFDDSNNDDSDEGGKERTRFKTERNINAVPRPTTAIPETLDAVAVKAQPNIAYNNRGGRGGQIIKRGFRGGIRGIGFQRGGGIHPRFRPQHPNNFGPMPPIHLQHKHHPDIGQSLHYQQNFSQMAMDSYSNEDCYQTPPTIPSQPSYQSQPLVQPPSTNIHVNPHFRGPRPQVNPNLTMWNGSGYAVSANQNPHQNYQHSQTSYQNHYQPAQSQQWSENNINDYYPPQNTSAATGNSYSQEEQYYNGVNAGSDHYYQQQSNQSNYQHSSATNLASNMAHHMNWNESGTNYYSNQSGPPPGPHHDLYNTQQLNPPIHQSPYRPQHNPHLPPHLQHKKVFMLNKKNPIFKNNKFQQTIANKGRGGKLMIHNMKKDVIQNKVTPPKPVRVETSALRKIQITNLHEVPVTNTVPQKKIIPEPEEEDEEMKAYRQKIEEQKKLREQVLKQKEEKRKVAAQQKFQMLAGTNRFWIFQKNYYKFSL
ncbi:hypothetical protein O3M35_002257 [Rhynocoris fuscipes]|uniref:Uncharacterized protein n=1 Tax=Rhynocoris fuscipes TaxID=488301 RepID=A0AAW1CRY1_9HEMI